MTNEKLMVELHGKDWDKKKPLVTIISKEFVPSNSNILGREVHIGDVVKAHGTAVTVRHIRRHKNQAV